ncbi:MAG TPA: GNAT family N-acetyltransferase, partial [Pyrinomonadaceae bacterium]|nr:GNAT family N-acetyltransferase [Pyrinomonadaceae bacterium]
TDADFDEFAAMRADAEVMRFIGKTGPQTREQSEAWLEKNRRRWEDEGFGMWAVCEKSDGRLVGWCGLSRLENTREVEVGYGLARAAWGRGLTTEAARAALRYGFAEKNVERVVAVAMPDNVGSRRVMEKVGLAYVRDAFFYGTDVVYYAIDSHDFLIDDSPYSLKNE